LLEFDLPRKIGYVNVHSFKAGRMNTFLVGSPGSFTVSTLTSNQNLGVGEFAMIFSPQKLGYPTTTIFYQGSLDQNTNLISSFRTGLDF
jgi:hypothetical protein